MERNAPSADWAAEKTSVLGLKLSLVVGISVGSVALAVLVLLLCRYSTIRKQQQQRRSKEAVKEGEVDKEMMRLDNRVKKKHNVVVDIESESSGSGGSSSTTTTTSGSGGSSSTTMAMAVSMSSVDMGGGWGQWYSLRELERATNGFAMDRVIGEGGYGIVYRGVLPDNSVVAIKNLLNNKGQAEKEFKVEVEAIGKVRHKNLASLIGYCAQGPRRMLVYEYLDNGNLEQWLHGDLGQICPLTWDIRMKIAIGTAKGLAYLHEGLEPKVIHRDVKSSNILLDKKWNPRVSDFGLAKLLGSDATYVTTRVMGTFGCVAPEYASTGMLSEGSDVYSFGVLLMEIISGRSPVDYARPAGEVNMVDWFKGMVASRRGEEVVDPLIKVLPSPRALKRALLVCLRCLDLDANKRPKMGQIVHMLEGDEFPFRSDNRSPRETGIPLANVGRKVAAPVIAGIGR